MDTRRTADPSGDRPKPELGTETVPVELIELQSVGRPGGPPPRALLLVAAIGIVALVGLVVIGRPPSPTPSPSEPPVGIASATPAASSSGPTIGPTTHQPTPEPPTPIPTAAPPWQWTRTALDASAALSPEGVVAVNGRMLILVRRFVEPTEAWGVVSIAGDEQPFYPAPSAIEELWGPSVVADRVWFLARVGGVRPDQATSQLVSTPDGASWESLGPAAGLGPHPIASFLGRVGGTWVTAIQQAGSGGVGAPTPEQLLWSADGVTWHAATLPATTGIVSYGGAANLGDTLVILGSDWRDDGDEDHFVLTSGDGQLWHRAALPVAGDNRLRGPVCGHGTCILIVAAFDDQGNSTEALLASTDGAQWTEVAMPSGSFHEASQVNQVVPTDTGFVAMSTGTTAWLSGDGRSWRGVDVLPPGLPDDFIAFAASGDLMVGLVAGDSEVPDGYWRGSLAAMGAASQSGGLQP